MDYDITATLVGRIVDDEAARIVAQLSDHAASVGTRPDQPERFDVVFALRAGSEREAVVCALSPSDDLGYPLVRLQVLPS